MGLNRTHDRCDKCNAQAYVKVTKGDLDLIFCAHHFTKFEFSLVEQGFVVDTDARADLLDEKAKRLVGSEN